MAAFNFPASPSNGDTYTLNSVTYQWDGAKWVRYSAAVGAQGNTGPTGPTGAQGAQGHQGLQGAQAHISTSAPSSGVNNGDLWWESDTGDLAIYYNDGNSSQWIDINTGPRGAQGATGPTGAQGATGSTGAQGAAGSNGGTDIVNDTSPQLGGDLDVNDFDIKNGNAIYEIISSARHNFYSGGNKIIDINGNGVDFVHGNNTHADNVQERFGNGNDLRIFHDASDSNITNTTGVFFIQNTGDLRLRVDDTDAAVHCVRNGAGELYHAGTKKFETTSSGATVTGQALASSGFKVNDGVHVTLGTDNDFKLYHDGSNAAWLNTTGNNYLYGSGGNFFIRPVNGDSSIDAIANGAVKLYHSGTKKFETTNDGITITRNTSDTTMTNTSQLVLRNENDGANTFAGIRFEVSSNSNTDHYIVQKKHSGGSGTDLIIGHGSNERIRFIESGGITFNGDTSSANALDDYEEGEVTISTTASNGNALTVDSSHNKLTYTKIGNVVNIFGYVYFASNSNADGYVQINSLPFTVKNATGSSAHARFVNTAYLTRNYAYLPDGAGYYNVQGYANESNTWLRYYDLNGSGRRLSTLAKFLGSGTVINVNFAYLTA